MNGNAHQQYAEVDQAVAERGPREAAAGPVQPPEYATDERGGEHTWDALAEVRPPESQRREHDRHGGMYAGSSANGKPGPNPRQTISSPMLAVRASAAKLDTQPCRVQLR